MIAECTIKMHGKWYHAGDELPSPAVPVTDSSTVTVAEIPEKPAYTKTEINRMSTKELKELAKETGIDGGADMTGTELKQYFISLWKL